MKYNSTLERAKAKKANGCPQDEFYTRLEDIANEMPNFAHAFPNKTIYCPCSDHTFSQFWQYFHMSHFKHHTRQVISTGYNECGNGTIAFQCQAETRKGILKGNGDFQSPELDKLWQEADIICDNPPFSLGCDFVQKCVDWGKDFILVLPKTAINYQPMKHLARQQKLFTGLTAIGKFNRPDGTNGEAPCFWFSNIQPKEITAKRKQVNPANKLDPEIHKPLDNYPDALNCDECKSIPMDYTGRLAVTPTFMPYFDPTIWYIHDYIRDVQVDGEQVFSRLIIQQKKYVDGLATADLDIEDFFMQDNNQT